MTREQRLELALRDALDLAARALEDVDQFVPVKNEAYDAAVTKLAELQKVLDDGSRDAIGDRQRVLYLESLIAKYAKHVGDQEGTDFIEGDRMSGFSDDEVAELKKLTRSV